MQWLVSCVQGSICFVKLARLPQSCCWPSLGAGYSLSAEAILQAFQIGETESKMYAVSSKEGSGPGQDQQSWRQLFSGTQ